MSAPTPPTPTTAGAAAPAQASTAQTAGQATSNSPQNLNQIVTDYLLKRGFTKTESVFRNESRHVGPDGRPVYDKMTDLGAKKYIKAFALYKSWVEDNLDIYKFELSKILWPFFFYSWLSLINDKFSDEPKLFVETLRSEFELAHADDLRLMASISLPEHAAENTTIRLYTDNKYKVPLNRFVYGDLMQFLEREEERGGAVLRQILSTWCQIDVIERGPIDTYSFEAIYRRSQNIELDEADMNEGVPGAFTGLANRQIIGPMAALKLGPLPMEPELREDVRAELMDHDALNPPAPGYPTLVEEFDAKVKREEGDDVPNRADLPLPPSRARDVLMEMQKVREYRDRFKIEGRTGGVGGVPISICMFSFHNSLGSFSALDFSADHELAAVGTQDSYIRIWSLTGKPLTSRLPHEKDLKINNRKLIGHSGPVYDVCFSDSIDSDDIQPFGDEARGLPRLKTNPRLLLSCSADGTIRLWSLELWQCLCVYKGHHGPVFRVQWSPHGHYFLSAGHDKTARVWMQDHASAQRILVGHDTPLSAIAWHPNGTYVFSASDETDKTIRMWSVITGECVRIFSGHTDYISTLECSPNGRILASADTSGSIMFWDIEKGTRIKRSRGHGKGGIWSLSFSAECNVLVSGGQDGTVRVWDVAMPADGHKAAAAVAAAASAVAAATANGVQEGVNGTDNSGSGSATATRPQTSTSAVPGDGAAPTTTTTTGRPGKKKGKDVMITPDQVSAFAAKKTPLLKVGFTRMNLVVAGGCYDPDR